MDAASPSLGAGEDAVVAAIGAQDGEDAMDVVTGALQTIGIIEVITTAIMLAITIITMIIIGHTTMDTERM